MGKQHIPVSRDMEVKGLITTLPVGRFDFFFPFFSLFCMELRIMILLPNLELTVGEDKSLKNGKL